MRAIVYNGKHLRKGKVNYARLTLTVSKNATFSIHPEVKREIKALNER